MLAWSVLVLYAATGRRELALGREAAPQARALLDAGTMRAYLRALLAEALAGDPADRPDPTTLLLRLIAR